MRATQVGHGAEGEDVLQRQEVQGAQPPGNFARLYPAVDAEVQSARAGNTKGGCISVPLTSCLMGLD